MWNWIVQEMDCAGNRSCKNWILKENGSFSKHIVCTGNGSWGKCIVQKMDRAENVMCKMKCAEDEV